MIFKTIKDIMNRLKKEEEQKESIQSIVYRLFKEKYDIEYIMLEHSLYKEEIIKMIQNERILRRVE